MAGFTTRFNAIAAFPDAAQARAAAEALAAQGIPDDAIHVGIGDRVEDEEEAAEMRAEMQDEISTMWGGPAFLMTGRQAKGAFVGVLISAALGLVVGLAVGLAWAFLFDEDGLSRLARVGVSIAISVVGFTTAGFIAGGGLQPRRDAARDSERPMDDQRTVAERDVLVGVHTEEREVVDRSAAVLRHAGAERVDLIDATGMPLPPQHEHPRPADPEGFWWGRSGRG